MTLQAMLNTWQLDYDPLEIPHTAHVVPRRCGPPSTPPSAAISRYNAAWRPPTSSRARTPESASRPVASPTCRTTEWCCAGWLRRTHREALQTHPGTPRSMGAGSDPTPLRLPTRKSSVVTSTELPRATFNYARDILLYMSLCWQI